MPSIPELEIIRRSQILEAALITISENGYANVTMDNICKAAKMSKGGLAHYFKSKNEVFQAAFEEFFNRIFERSRETMQANEDPIDQLLSFSWLYDVNDPDSMLGYPLLFDCMSIAVHQPEYGKLFHDWVDNWIRLLKVSLEAAIDSGQLLPLDSNSTARTISAIYNGIATRWYLDRESHTSEWAIDSFQKAISGLLMPYLKDPKT
jgi:AcrR family transcriptional regulator